MFEVTDKPIRITPILAQDDRAGGIVSFEGRVRSANEGKIVTMLDYEIYTALALAEGNRILNEMRARYSLFHAYGIHRSGRLNLGETAIWIHASAMHRRAAFEGVEAIIHAIKHSLPVWKKEWYSDGSAQWVNCHHHDHQSKEPA